MRIVTTTGLSAVLLGMALSACNGASQQGQATTGADRNQGGTNEGAGQITLSWTPPATRQDGEPLNLSELAGYRVRYGDEPGQYDRVKQVTNPSETSTTISGLAPGSYYLVVTSYDRMGLESTYSDAVQFNVQ